MRLQLQDNARPGMVKVVKKKSGVHHVFDPSTNQVHFINDAFMPLEGKARKRRVKLRKADKAERQSIRHQGRKTNLLKRIAKRGRKQDNKFQPDTDQGAITTPDGGAMPQQPSAPSGGGGGGGNPISPGGGEDYSSVQMNPQDQPDDMQPDQEETDPSTYEQLPDEEGESVDPYGAEGVMNDYYNSTGLSAKGGIWGTIFTAGKGAVKGAINQIKTDAANKLQPVQVAPPDPPKDPYMPYKIAGGVLGAGVAAYLIYRAVKK